MKHIESSTLLSFVRSLDGETLTTVQRGASFMLHVDSNQISVTPSSSGKQRPISQVELDRVLHQFAQTGSFAPGEYIHLSVNASYLLTIIQRYIEQ